MHWSLVKNLVGHHKKKTAPKNNKSENNVTKDDYNTKPTLTAENSRNPICPPHKPVESWMHNPQCI